ncbi:MAG: NgoBV family restriction endonuclease [Oscillospiraceae bacterium]|nr:NgoBV family restriction endonuclease [Oscillospiraceae bacterium]MCL2126012.1 NgoBV family restriction endonuclease [Oscillospiraceae bacterium]
MDEDRVLALEGRIRFFFGDVDIIVKQKDVVGNIIQEWVQGWLEKREIEYALSQNTQMPPDFFLSPDDMTVNLLEVKAFNKERTPGFDIADFGMFASEVIDKPYMLDADYLVFGYKMDEGVVTVNDLWLKKVWQITCSSAAWPMKLQVKKSVVHKIRPGVFYSTRAKYKPFACLEDFLSALEQSIYQNRDTRELAQQWQNRFLASYRAHFGVNLNIPRWIEIADRYK